MPHKYNRGAYCTDIKFFSDFPLTITSLNRDIKVFNPALKDGFFIHPYSADDFSACYKNSYGTHSSVVG
jgi:hypothetical protein